jgi:hypothetical protein|tara:strand:+ start:3799 stop:6402 length:2604 start_codon:yes stop_codon:yes gene_type:complete
MTDPNEHKIGFENLPNVYFKRIRTRIQPVLSNNDIIVSGLLTIFEGENAKYWDDDPYFQSLLRIRIRVFREVTEAAAVVAAGGLIEEVAEEQFIYGPFEGNRPISFRVDVPKDKINGLYISANLEMDIDSISGASFDWTDNQWYRGPTTEERIFDGQNKVLTMYRFVNGDNVHFGPVHSHVGQLTGRDIFMAGSFHNDPTPGATRPGHTLIMKENDSENYKNSYVENNFADINIETGFDPPLYVPAVFLTNFDSNQESVYFHMYVSDSNLALKTEVGRKLFQINPEYFQEIDNKTETRMISTSRTRIVRTPNGTQTSNGSGNILSSIWPGDPIQESYEYETGTIYLDLTDAPVKSKITKWPFEINNDISLYSIIDYDVSPLVQEHFKYSIKIEYVSLIDQMLKDKISEMRTCVAQIQSNLQFFYSTFYDHDHQIMTPAGFKEINKEYGYGVLDIDRELVYSPDDDDIEKQKQAYWTKGPQLYADLIRFLKRTGDLRPDYTSLFSMLNPISASPETINSAIIKILSVIGVVESVYDLEQQGGLYSIAGLPSSSDNKYEHSFESNELTEHAAYLAGTPQYDYLGQNTDREVFAGALEQRIDTELAEFMDGLSTIEPSQYPDYSQQQLSQLLSPNGSYSFLTPFQAVLQGNNINMTSLDADGIDKIQATKMFNQGFNGLVVSKPTPNIQGRKGTITDANDVREYVGDQSLFATGVDTFLDSFIMAPPEVSKTISNLYSNKGGNVNIASIKASNISTSMLPASVKNILSRDFGDIDPFESLETRDAFFNKYFNIIQISYLSSFPKAFGHLYNISNPTYEPLTKSKLNELQDYLICKSEPINVLSSCNSSYEEIERKNIRNRVFIVKGDNVS